MLLQRLKYVCIVSNKNRYITLNGNLIWILDLCILYWVILLQYYIFNFLNYIHPPFITVIVRTSFFYIKLKKPLNVQKSLHAAPEQVWRLPNLLFLQIMCLKKIHKKMLIRKRVITSVFFTPTVTFKNNFLLFVSALFEIVIFLRKLGRSYIDFSKHRGIVS